MQRAENPNEQQEQFARNFMRRLKVEVFEKQQRRLNESSQEPHPDLEQGFPGTGKSALIAWMRELMDDELVWEHRVDQRIHFASLARHTCPERRRSYNWKST